MITWMQHHKKYLVITIWVATIAFIGAGFVGWGAYDFNSDRASAVAKVENRKVSVQDFQLAYANYYNFYNNMLGGTLTQEKADQMGLEKIVMNAIINETLLLSYADEIGLRVLDSEVKEAIANDDAFKNNGVFNKETYYRVVKQTGIKPKEYEQNLKKTLLLEKVQKALDLKPSKMEQEIFSSAMFMKDRLAIDIIKINADEVTINEDEIKKYWEEHKTEYLTEKSFDLATIKIGASNKDVDQKELKSFYEEKKYDYKKADGKLKSFDEAYEDVLKDYRIKMSKREALETYLLFKKSQMNPTGKMNVKISDKNFPVEKIKNARLGQVLKPIQFENGFIIVKVTSINEPKPKPYIEAKDTIYKKLKSIKQAKMLKKQAKARLGIFNGQDIGFVTRDSKKQIPGLSNEESIEFVNYVFDTNKASSYKIIGNKAILYKILEQNLLNKDKLQEYVDLINTNIMQIKKAEINQNLISELKKRYAIEQYYKGK
ncbi:SurA N-terminal domain-containing protein [Sulfurospirillum sp. 1307]|jgi:peptidyl-prolyl cis-trans isomerase D